MDIPSAETKFQEEVEKIKDEETYEAQVEKVLEEIKKINKNNSSVVVSFKALPNPELLTKLESQGYEVKFDTYYDSKKVERYMTKLRVTNPNFKKSDGGIFEQLEDQIKSCPFSASNIQVSEDAKKILESFMSSFK